MIIKFKKLHKDAKVPQKVHPNDACFDVYATSRKDLGDGRIEYGLGFALQPEDLQAYGQFDLRPRSSIHKTGLLLSNSVGTGDFSYIGQYKAVFYHAIPSLPPYEVGERILQMQTTQAVDIEFVEVDELDDTDRGVGGFGSTGNK